MCDFLHASFTNTSEQDSRIDIRGAVLADDCIVTIAIINAGYSAMLLPLSALEGRWNFGDSTRVSSNEQKVKLTPAMQTVIPLPVPSVNELQGDRTVIDDPNRESEDWTPYLLGHRVFTPSWKQGVSTDILIAASYVENWTDMQLLSHHLRVTREVVPAAESPNRQGHVKHSLSVISTACVPSPELPWNPCSLSIAGHMFTLDSQLRCFSLLVNDGGQPLNGISLGSEFNNAHNSFHPVLSAVEPWSGSIAVRIYGQVRVLYFD